MEKIECIVCGYIYNAEIGDKDNGIEPGTPFNQLPESWVCPDCGSPKYQFEDLKKVDNNKESEVNDQK